MSLKDELTMLKIAAATIEDLDDVAPQGNA